MEARAAYTGDQDTVSLCCAVLNPMCFPPLDELLPLLPSSPYADTRVAPGAHRDKLTRRQAWKLDGSFLRDIEQITGPIEES